MKKLSFIALVCLLAWSASAAFLNDAKNIRVFSGKLTVSQGDSVLLLDDDFKAPSDAWILPHKVYENFTWIHHGETNGVPTLRIERNPKRALPPKGKLFDTAWELRTKPTALPKNAVTLILELAAYSNQPEMANAAGCRESFHNAVYWLNGKDDTIGKSFFKFNVANAYPAVTLKEFDVPAGAVKFQLTLGADTPDLLEKEYVAFSHVKLSAIPMNGRYSPSASFVTRSLRITGGIAVDAEIPAGSGIRLQVAVAPEVNSVPGKWSAFKDIDTAAFPKGVPEDAKWMKVKVNFTAQEHAAPILNALKIGSTVLDQWRYGGDLQAPVATPVSVSPTERADLPYVFSVTDDNVIDWRTLSVSIDGVDATKSVSRDMDTLTIAVPEGGWKTGIHIIGVSVADEHGNKNQEELVLYVGKSRTTNIVTMRDDGMTLVDGKPFFPLGMACAVKCEHNGNDYDKLFAMFQEAGMNFARHYSAFTKFQKDAAEYVAAAEKHGIKLYIAAGRRGANDCDIRTLAEGVLLQQDMPNLAWDTGDDTSMHITAEQMRQRYNAIKAVDPWRITTQADPIGSFVNTRYRPYALYSDNFSPEIYPVHNTSKQDMDAVVPTVVSSMKAIQDDWKAVKAPVRSCWPLIQYFYNCGGWNRLQTTEELRCMSYQAIIHGAQGVIWYRYAGYKENNKTGFTPEQWNRVVTVSKELRSLYDVLCMRNASAQPQCPEVLTGAKKDCLQNPSVSLLLKGTEGDKRYLFVATSVREPVTAKITLPFAPSSVVDFFDGHACKTDANGAFTENFKPLDVHVYTVTLAK